jgi:uncharacterized repeat protein (TIGR03803 family)
MNIIKSCILLSLAATVACAGSTASAVQYTLTTLATFNGTNGSNPYAGLIADASGNLYGTTRSGGANGYGTVFELAAGTHALSTLATFNATNGDGSFGDLIADASGNLFGTTFNGGANNAGTVFKVAAGTHALSTLASFNRTNGAYPYAGLIADASGNLYGTTEEGGANNAGTVFKVAADTHALSTLVTFNGTNGADPRGRLIADASGNLYGTTFWGGANGSGTVFEVANDVNHTLTTLATFNGANGAIPVAGLIFDASGNLYGTTAGGGANNRGTVFEVANDVNHTLTTLATFNGANGAIPEAGLIFDASGNLYGTTSEGGANGRGTVFILRPVLEPGSNQNDPILPDNAGGAPFIFNNVASDMWFDPPLVPAFMYTAQPGTIFSQILDFPTGFSSPFTVAAAGSTLGQFGPGQSVSFAGFPGGGVSEFTVSGINPLVDTENPRGFPLRIGFTTPTGSFVMTAVPEPSALALGLFALSGMSLFARVKSKRA